MKSRQIGTSRKRQQRPSDERLADLAQESKDRYRALIDADAHHLVVTLELLGGHKVFAETPRSLLDVHRWVSHGIPSASIFYLAHAVEPLSSETLSEALGVSLRTLHRRRGHPTIP